MNFFVGKLSRPAYNSTKSDGLFVNILNVYDRINVIRTTYLYFIRVEYDFKLIDGHFSCYRLKKKAFYVNLLYAYC